MNSSFSSSLLISISRISRASLVRDFASSVPVKSHDILSAICLAETVYSLMARTVMVFMPLMSFSFDADT